MHKESFKAGNVYIVVEGDSRKIKVEGFSYNEEMLDFTGQFSVKVPNSYKHYIPAIPFIGVDLYIDDTYYTTGYLTAGSIGNSDGNNYNFIGCGYQVVKTDITINSTTTTTDMNLNEFLDHTINSNLVANIACKINEKNYNAANNSELREMNFMIYDPFDLGIYPLSNFLQKNPEVSKNTMNMLDYLRTITQSDNIFLKCLGKYEKVKSRLDPSKIYNRARQTALTNLNITGLKKTALSKSVNNFFTNLRETSAPISEVDVTPKDNFVIMLWKPQVNSSYNPFRAISIAEQDDKTNKLTRRVVVNYENKYKYTKAYEILTKQKLYDYQNSQVIGSISSTQPTFHVANLNYLKDNYKNNLLGEPILNFNFSDRFQCYIAEGQDTNLVDNINPTSSIEPLSLSDPGLNDGTTKRISFKDNPNAVSVGKLLGYEVNKRISNSIDIEVEVIGFKQGLTAKNLIQGIDRTKLKFWGVNQTVYLNSNGMVNNIKCFLLTSSISMSYDNSKGATTTLKLVLPESYTEIINNSLLFLKTVKVIKEVI